MSNSDFGLLTLQLALLLATAMLLGELFQKLRQPRVIGEIAAGALLGPSVLGYLAPGIAARIFSAGGNGGEAAVLEFIYNLGLLLLMFVSGAETRSLFHRDDRQAIGWLSTVGTLVPFLTVVAAAPWIPLERMMGSIQQRTPMLLVLGIAVAVTSIPVISRILHDLGIMQTRFARLVLGVAVLEDIALWAVLAIATSLVSSGSLPAAHIAMHIALTLVFLFSGLVLLPQVIAKAHDARWNILARSSPVGYAIVVMLLYTAVASAMQVSLVFAAFLAGFALASDVPVMADALAAIKKFSFAVFIPIYFAVVGYRLDLSRSFSFTLLVGFLSLACLLKVLSVAGGSKLAGFSWRDTVNLAVATNARGGPGIVLASVAYDAKIINAPFYTTLVLAAVLTSQFAGWWLGYVVRSGKPLLELSQVKARKGGAEEQPPLAA